MLDPDLRQRDLGAQGKAGLSSAERGPPSEGNWLYPGLWRMVTTSRGVLKRSLSRHAGCFNRKIPWGWLSPSAPTQSWRPVTPTQQPLSSPPLPLLELRPPSAPGRAPWCSSLVSIYEALLVLIYGLYHQLKHRLARGHPAQKRQQDQIQVLWSVGLGRGQVKEDMGRPGSRLLLWSR